MDNVKRQGGKKKDRVEAMNRQNEKGENNIKSIPRYKPTGGTSFRAKKKWKHSYHQVSGADC